MQTRRRRSITERATTRYLRLAIRRGDVLEARRYAAELVGFKARRAPDAAKVADCLATFVAAVWGR
jgi:hypothetical protein